MKKGEKIENFRIKKKCLAIKKLIAFYFEKNIHIYVNWSNFNYFMNWLWEFFNYIKFFKEIFEKN